LDRVEHFFLNPTYLLGFYRIGLNLSRELDLKIE